MRKLSLEIESLEVESFQTAPPSRMRGTAYAHAPSNGCNAHEPVDHVAGWPAEPPPAGTGYPQETCYGTCYFSCGCSLPC